MSDQSVMLGSKAGMVVPPRPSRPVPALPPAAARRARGGPARWIVILFVLGALGLGGWLAYRWVFSGAPALVTGQYHRVEPMDLELKIVKEGELNSIRNTEIICQVEGQTTIQWIEKEGAVVAKDAKLMQLDASEITRKIEDISLDVATAKADLEMAEQMEAISKSQNDANINSAEVAVELAQLDLDQYKKGKFPQDKANAEITLKMAELQLKNKEEELEQTQGLVAKGFMTLTDLKRANLDVLTARNEVQKAKTALTVLVEYTYKKDLAAYQNALDQAKEKRDRTKREAEAQALQRAAEVRAKRQRYELPKRRLDHYLRQQSYCTIKAPEEGLVVYASSGGRGDVRVIEEGAVVRERQPLIRLPDVREMKAVIRVNESQVHKLKEEMAATVHIDGVRTPARGTVRKISAMPDNAQWWNPDLKEYPVEIYLDETPRGMKPRRASRVEILVDRVTQVLAVPVAAIYSQGGASYVFVRSGDSQAPRPQAVKLGLTNETHVQIREGLEPQAEVLLLQPGQGRALLERAGIKIAPETRPADRPRRGRRGGGKSQGA